MPSIVTANIQYTVKDRTSTIVVIKGEATVLTEAELLIRKIAVLVIGLKVLKRNDLPLFCLDGKTANTCRIDTEIVIIRAVRSFRHAHGAQLAEDP